jgi:hypothetical protein
MATASAVRAAKGSGRRAAALVSTTPLKRPCSAAASRSRESIRPDTEEEEKSSLDWPARRGAHA